MRSEAAAFETRNINTLVFVTIRIFFGGQQKPVISSKPLMKMIAFLSFFYQIKETTHPPARFNHVISNFKTCCSLIIHSGWIGNKKSVKHVHDINIIRKVVVKKTLVLKRKKTKFHCDSDQFRIVD